MSAPPPKTVEEARRHIRKVIEIAFAAKPEDDDHRDELLQIAQTLSLAILAGAFPDPEGHRSRGRS